MLQKPRRWLAYTVELNDLLPSYERILDRFERSDVPLDGVFGSGSVSTSPPLGILVAIGPAVEPQRLDEILRLVEDLDLLFLVVHDDPPHNKVIIIGSMNLEAAPFVAVTPRLLGVIRGPRATAADVTSAIAAMPKVQAIRKRETKY